MSDKPMTSADLWEQIEGEHVCMMASMNGEVIKSRPMAPIIRKDEGRIWFFTDRNSSKAGDLADDSPVTLTFQNSASNFYISVMGTGSVVDDAARIAEMWSPLMKEWFDGPHDKRIILIGFEPSEADYWNGPNRLVAGLKMLVTATTGMKTDMGDAGTVRM
jgi:general stress protein 26